MTSVSESAKALASLVEAQTELRTLHEALDASVNEQDWAQYNELGAAYLKADALVNERMKGLQEAHRQDELP